MNRLEQYDRKPSAAGNERFSALRERVADKIGELVAGASVGIVGIAMLVGHETDGQLSRDQEAEMLDQREKIIQMATPVLDASPEFTIPSLRDSNEVENISTPEV